MTETQARSVVESAGAHYIGIQAAAEVIGEDLVLFGAPARPRAALAIRKSNVNEFEILLALAAAHYRYTAGARP